MYDRKRTKRINVGSVAIGGGADIAVQSMCSTDTRDIAATSAQIEALAEAGCAIVRVAVPDMEAARAVYELKKRARVPLVADIHFDYRLALECAAAGIDKIRINPGNIGDDGRVKAVADACRERGIPIRIGVNSGSVSREILAKYGGPTPEALVSSALYHISLLEKFDFDNIAVSIKSSDVRDGIEAYTRMSEIKDYPLHIGVTEAGTERMGVIKSAVGIGALLCRGIGDTIRVSLTADPVREVYAGYDILRACGLLRKGVSIVSCPTCGRTKIDLISLAQRAEKELADIEAPLKVAIMGCVVNGPGEAREADVGIAGGDGVGLLFKKGEIVKKLPQEALLGELIAEVRRMDGDYRAQRKG